MFCNLAITVDSLAHFEAEISLRLFVPTFFIILNTIVLCLPNTSVCTSYYACDYAGEPTLSDLAGFNTVSRSRGVRACARAPCPVALCVHACLFVVARSRVGSVVCDCACCVAVRCLFCASP